MKITPWAVAALAALTGAAGAQTIDFDTLAPGNYASLGNGGATLTYANGLFDVLPVASSGLVSGHVLTSYFFHPDDPAPFRVSFAGGGNSFTVSFADDGEDADTGFLNAFDASGMLLASSTATTPEGSDLGALLAVSSATPIAYVEFGSTGEFAGSVYWDNISYEAAAVPEPATMALFGLGLAGAAALARRRRSA